MSIYSNSSVRLEDSRSRKFLRVFKLAMGVAILGLSGSIWADPISEAQAEDGDNGVTLSATGGGHFLISGTFDVAFSFSANQKDNGTANGQFRMSVELGGLPIDFHGEVICLVVDSANGRAWVGGVVTQNNSEHPSFTTPIHQPGRDVWFRVLDNGEGGNSDMDRSTFMGFEGGGGIITSEEYCELQIWPDENARTSPVTQGNIQVRP
jgi:hypothetical protein